MDVDTELAWMGGFFDAEGNVGINSQSVQVKVTNANMSTLQVFTDRFNFAGPYRSGHSVALCVEANHAKSVPFLTAILPYLVIKKGRAQTALEFQKLKRWTGGVGYSHEERIRMFQVSERMRWMNTKGREATYCVDAAERFPDETLWPYLAGFIDGDGSLGVDKKGRLVVQISNAHPAPLKWVAKEFEMKVGEEIRSASNARPYYHVHVSGGKAVIFIKRIYPYLIEKKETARLLLEKYGERT